MGLLLDPFVSFPVGGVGGAGDRYWRIYGTANVSGANAQYAEIKGAQSAGGADVFAAAPTKTPSSEFSGSFLIANAFDGNTATAWAATGSADQYVIIDFGAGNGKDIVEIKLQRTSTQSAQAFTDIVVHSSTDGSTWRLRGVYHALVNPGSLGFDTLAIPVDVNPSILLSHRYWRLYTMKSAAPLVVGEWELINGAGANVANTIGGTVTAQTQQGGSLSADKAFDTLLTTGWASTANAIEWIKMDFGASPQILTKYALRPHNSWVSLMPLSWSVEYSDDDATWYCPDTRQNVAAWTAGDRREYVF